MPILDSQSYHSIMAAAGPPCTDFGATMKVLTIGPCGEESNYSYLIYDTSTMEAACVDTGDCTADVNKVVAAKGLKLQQILTTHHHYDHADGNADMAKRYPGIAIIGGDEDEVEACTKWVKNGDSWTLGQNQIKITALSTPGHTAGHMVRECHPFLCYATPPGFILRGVLTCVLHGVP